MSMLLELLSQEMKDAFEAAGYDRELGEVVLSNRPELCEYQCNGAMAGAKKLHKPPMEIASGAVKKLEGSSVFSSAEAVAPGFINLNIREDFLAAYLRECAAMEKPGVELSGKSLTIIVDYGGPNVAKPLHVGHLRAAVIGESVKRICAYMGNRVIGDIHMGDWGLQMGLIIHELSVRKPELPYFDPDFKGEYPKEPPFTISELEEIYPTASSKTKTENPDGSKKSEEELEAALKYKAAAMDATYRLQHGDRGALALWRHIMDVSTADLRKNYDNLNVSFELWKGEADADPYIAPMIERLKETGLMYESDGALVVDVREEGDKKEMPPCMILKSDGASLYTTTDLATLVQRMEDYSPDRVIYVVDKRQQMHFDQVFRTAKKTGIVPGECDLTFIGFGTMNGKDGKPFKTREGGVMRLESLIGDITARMQEKMEDNRNLQDETSVPGTAQMVAVAALKYGDLSNQATKDYVFDPDRFTSFEGNTGPYILYTMVRIGSILGKYREMGVDEKVELRAALSPQEKEVQRLLALFGSAVRGAYAELAPHRICAYIYELANALNSFYHETRILAEEDGVKRGGYIALLSYAHRILSVCIDLLGFECPERM